MAKDKDVASFLDELDVNVTKEHEDKLAKVTGQDEDARATALVSMTKSDKERLTSVAKAHGLSLSAFFRLAADEYIAAHKW